MSDCKSDVLSSSRILIGLERTGIG